MNQNLLEQALDALERSLSWISSHDAAHEVHDAIEALRIELSKPVQEPVGYVYTHNGMAQGALTNKAMIAGTPLYAAPVDCRCSRQMGHLGTASGEYVKHHDIQPHVHYRVHSSDTKQW